MPSLLNKKDQSWQDIENALIRLLDEGVGQKARKGKSRASSVVSSECDNDDDDDDYVIGSDVESSYEL